jgi:ketosteroid isomerase-like protein
VAEARLQELLDREAIKELKARYLRCVDAKEWEGFRQTLADDATFQVMDREPIEGADAFVAWVQQASAGSRGVHHGHMPELTFTSPTEAHGTWVLYEYNEREPDPETGGRRGFEGYGRYDESYRKVDGEWKIARWRLSYLRMDALPPEPLPDRIAGLDGLQK